ncbi:MAG TPA: TetR/AcrR family transcriptional regulator [Rhizomicrobium sp.]|jgi:DNA-binding transcriptional regulator YbjK|nr:TetR/AcrR family transcriptional regulator [Rhizomicrobium sp.]
MPYPTGHRTAQREKIVQSARRLFNRHGFNEVSVARIMAGAGLTHGTFYTYFESKNDLYTEALACFFTDPNWKNSWDGVSIDPSESLGPQIVNAYLSRAHFDDIENSCPMIALPTDVARDCEKTKRAFENVFAAMVEMLGPSVQGDTATKAVTARAIAALCVGGMVAARAMATKAAADDLREACRIIACQLGGWAGGEKRLSRKTHARRGKATRVSGAAVA